LNLSDENFLDQQCGKHVEEGGRVARAIRMAKKKDIGLGSHNQSLISFQEEKKNSEFSLGL
jgi:hypothetical protein